MTERIKIKKPQRDMENHLFEGKELLRRLANGDQYISSAMKKGNIIDASKGVRLFLKYAEELQHHMEQALFIHEMITAERTVLVTKDGKPVKAENVLEGIDEVETLSPFALESIKKMKEVFGEDYFSILEITK